MDEHRPPIDRFVGRMARAKQENRPFPWAACILVASFFGLTYFFTFTPVGNEISLWIGQ